MHCDLKILYGVIVIMVHWCMWTPFAFSQSLDSRRAADFLPARIQLSKIVTVTVTPSIGLQKANVASRENPGMVTPAARIYYSICLGPQNGVFRLATWLEPLAQGTKLPDAYGKIVREWVVSDSSTFFVMDNQATKNRPYGYIGMPQMQLGELLSNQSCLVDGYLDIEDVRYDLWSSLESSETPVIDRLLAGTTEVFEFGNLFVKASSVTNSNGQPDTSIQVHSESKGLLYAFNKLQFFPSGAVKSYRYQLSDDEWWDVSCEVTELGDTHFDEFEKTRQPMTEFVEIAERRGEVFARKRGQIRKAVDGCLIPHKDVFFNDEDFIFKDYIRSRSSKHCGLYAAINVAIENGISSINLENVLSPDYVSQQSGSTVEDLRRLLSTEFSLETKVVRNAEIAFLRRSDNPTILHFGNSYQAEGAAHWVACLGVDEEGRFRIVDAPHPESPMTAAELLTQWDGLLIVTGHPNSVGTVYNVFFQQVYSVVSRLFSCIVFAFVACIAHRLLGKRAVGFGSSISIILATVVGCTLFSQFSSASSYMNNPQSVTFSLSKTPLVNEIEYSVTESDSSFHQAQVIDARTPSSFSAGHFPGAHNLPVDASLAETKRVIEAIGDRDKQIVVYCQSSKCHWADLVAKRLMFFGFDNVMVFRPGWKVLSEK